MPKIYLVLSDPKSGQATGDWLVKRANGGSVSRHRKKSAAIKKAKQIARNQNAQVRIQNRDGTWRQGPGY